MSTLHVCLGSQSAAGQVCSHLVTASSLCMTLTLTTSPSHVTPAWQCHECLNIKWIQSCDLIPILQRPNFPQDSCTHVFSAVVCGFSYFWPMTYSGYNTKGYRTFGFQSHFHFIISEEYKWVSRSSFAIFTRVVRIFLRNVKWLPNVYLVLREMLHPILTSQ